jgi:hypothetical protein
MKWSILELRLRYQNPKVAGSNPAPLLAKGPRKRALGVSKGVHRPLDPARRKEQFEDAACIRKDEYPD